MCKCCLVLLTEDLPRHYPKVLLEKHVSLSYIYLQRPQRPAEGTEHMASISLRAAKKVSLKPEYYTWLSTVCAEIEKKTDIENGTFTSLP